MKNAIRVMRARVHNLKNISVDIPKNALVVFTGLSGSGKSSLAFDTIFAEGQRRYMESLSPYARQFLGGIEKPDVDYIEGLAPAIAINQQTAGRSPRSTVGTMSDVYDYLRLLFARAGTVHCPNCEKSLRKAVLKAQSAQPVGLAEQPLQPVKLVEGYVCEDCNVTIPEITLGSFSFNSPEGACPDCQGLGVRLVINPELVLPNPRLTIAEGAIRPWTRTTAQSAWYVRALEDLAKKYRFSLDTPVSKLSEKVRGILLYGDRDLVGEDGFEGIIPNLERRYRETDSDYLKREIEKYMERKVCPTCKGQRLRPEVLGITFQEKNIVDVVTLTIESALKLFAQDVDLEPGLQPIAQPVLREIRRRLTYLSEVGLGYLTLDRSADTLSGGEAQRIRLATQLGAQLSGVIYILDEPSIGLHAKDQKKLMEVLRDLRDLGNSVLVVEHDAQAIAMADWVIDMGPGAGERGGKIVALGTPQEIKANPRSLTGQYLTGAKEIPAPAKRRSLNDKAIVIKGATAHNLKNIDVRIPLGMFVVLSGVSGSGKSTLVDDILAKALAKRLHRAKAQPGAHKAIEGVEQINKVIAIDQSPIGRTPRSNPATYVNFFTPIRELFAHQPDAQKRRFDSGHFSFNVRGGRCEDCRGEGAINVEMHFLPDVYVACAACNGQRYKSEILEILYEGKSIADVLNMTVSEAREFFAGQTQITVKLDILEAVGLGYLRLGQPATNLSGGEAQRIKLATELARPATGQTLYILDEPTTGLHFEDIRKLLGVLQALVEKGNSVLVIEHNIDVIKAADWVIDLGPDGGDAGGEIVAQGTPEQVARTARSVTGKFIAAALPERSKKSSNRMGDTAGVATAA